MLKGLIKIYSFTIITNIDTDVITKKLNDIFLKQYVLKKTSNIFLDFLGFFENELDRPRSRDDFEGYFDTLKNFEYKRYC